MVCFSCQGIIIFLDTRWNLCYNENIKFTQDKESNDESLPRFSKQQNRSLGSIPRNGIAGSKGKCNAHLYF